MEYVLNISDVNTDKEEKIGYYSSEHPWKRVPREQATILTNKNAERVRRAMRKIGYNAVFEPV